MSGNHKEITTESEYLSLLAQLIKPDDGIHQVNKALIGAFTGLLEFAKQGSLGNVNGNQNLVFATPDSLAGSASLRALTSTDIPSLSASKITSGVINGDRLGTGRQVTYYLKGDGTYDFATKNVTIAVPGIFDISQGYSTNDYSATINLKAYSDNKFLAAPSNGTSGTPDFRTIVNADLPTIAVSKGGTGLTTLGSSLQYLRVNNSASGLEYGDLNSAVLGSVLTGLNVTGSTVIATDTILQAFGKLQNQINSAVSGVSYQGTWNATTNSPSLTSGVGTKGHYYVVSTAGTTTIDGINDWKLGDWIIFNGTTWDKVDNTDAVISVNGYIGAVTLTKSDVGLGSVENTALSTWAGTTNITTLGTIVAGVWNGTAIGDSYISSATNWNAAYLWGNHASAGYLTANQSITLSGDISGTGTTTITTAIGANKVLNTMIRQSAALSVIGRSANSTGDVADIAAGSDGHVLRRSGTSLGFGTLASGAFASNTISRATLSNGTALSIIGRSANSSGAVADIAAGTDGHVLRRSGTTLGFGQIATAGITDAAVTYAKIQNVAAGSFLANVNVVSGAVQEIATNRIPLFSSAITGTPSATTFLKGDGSWSGTINDAIGGVIPTVADETITLIVKAPYAGTINEVTTQSESGTCTATFKINGTALGGTANSVSTSSQTEAHTTSNTFSAGDAIQVTLSSNSSCLKLSFIIKVTRSI
jgi:hypothetical protein